MERGDRKVGIRGVDWGGGRAGRIEKLQMTQQEFTNMYCKVRRKEGGEKGVGYERGGGMRRVDTGIGGGVREN